MLREASQSTTDQLGTTNLGRLWSLATKRSSTFQTLQDRFQSTRRWKPRTCTLRRQSSFSARYLVTQCQLQRIVPTRCFGLGIWSPMFTNHAMLEAYAWKMSSPRRMETVERIEFSLGRIGTCTHFGMVCLGGISTWVTREGGSSRFPKIKNYFRTVGMILIGWFLKFG